MRALLLTSAVLAFALGPTSSAHAVSVVEGSATCEGLGTQSYELPQLATGQYSLDAGNSLWFAFSPDSDRIFYFTNSTVRVTGVLAEGGGKTLVWSMPDGGATGWPSLHAPDDPLTGEPYPLEAVTFCFDYHLYLNPNAYARQHTTWSWDIEKSGPSGLLNLSPEQAYLADYDTTVTPSSTVGHVVEGPVFISNPTPIPTTISAVSVLLDTLAADVTCPGSLPQVLAAFSGLQCSFSATLPDGVDRQVYVDVEHDGSQGITRSIEQFNFVSGTETDECVTINDTMLSGTFSTCASAGQKSFAYSASIGPFYGYGTYQVMNTATVTGTDTDTAHDSDTWTVTVRVAETLLGCSLMGAAKAHKLGSVVPLKLQVCDRDGNNRSDPSLVVRARSLRKVDDVAYAAVEDAGSANPGNDFRYDAELGGYVFNKSTKGLSPGTWRLVYSVGDRSPDPAFDYLEFDVR